PINSLTYNYSFRGAVHIDSWPNEKMDLDKLIDLAWHELYHYYSDEDIRLKDKEYEKWQINKLKNISDKLLQ
ncbi:MAG: hypothetical protein AB1498_02170, partial [bacterium]